MPIESFDLSILFRTEGALVGGAFVKVLVSALKNMGLIPEFGRSSLMAAAAISLLLIGLALWGAPWISDGINGQEVFTALMAWAGLYAAAVGVHETAAKVQRIMQSETNPHGPDAA